MLKDSFEELAVGDWCFINGTTHIGIKLSDKENDSCILPIQNLLAPRYIEGVSWNWDGNMEAPTLTPSILHWGAGRDNPPTWHGYLKNGKLETT